MRAVSNNAQALITELGIIVRWMALLQFPKWKAIPNDNKNKMWHAIKKISKRCKESRGRQNIGHIAGTKAFSWISYDNRDPAMGNEPSQTKLWHTTRFSERKRLGWIRLRRKSMVSLRG